MRRRDCMSVRIAAFRLLTAVSQEITAYVLSANMVNDPIQDGDDFRLDGWVYGPDGQRRRKWFTGILGEQGRIWPPKLDSIAPLEAKRWKWHTRTAEKNRLLWDEIQPKVKALGRCGGKIKSGAARSREKSESWVYLTSSEKGVSWTWTEEGGRVKPSLINQPLVDEWFRYEDQYIISSRRLGILNAAFVQAVWRRYQERILKDENFNMLHVIINGRDYWFQRPRRRDGGSSFQRIAYPEDTYVVTETI